VSTLAMMKGACVHLHVIYFEIVLDNSSKIVIFL
jgi:hypothetical protein